MLAFTSGCREMFVYVSLIPVYITTFALRLHYVANLFNYLQFVNDLKNFKAIMDVVIIKVLIYLYIHHTCIRLRDKIFNISQSY